jgi:WhiB family redox-sensing transcriptional regulator
MTNLLAQLDAPIADENWRRYAACRGLETSLFFIEGRAGNYREALKVCEDCPVVQDCLHDALRWELSADWCSGIWGGKTPQQREKMLDVTKSRRHRRRKLFKLAFPELQETTK